MERVALFLLENRNGSVRLYADVQNFDPIRDYIFGSELVKDEFRDIWGIIREDLRIPEKYKKVKATIKGKDLYAMVFAGGGSRDLILCLDKKNIRVRNVIMIKLFTGISEESLAGFVSQEIEKKGSYDYELDE